MVQLAFIFKISKIKFKLQTGTNQLTSIPFEMYKLMKNELQLKKKSQLSQEQKKDYVLIF